MYEGNGSKVILVGLVGFLGSGRKAISNFLHYSYGFVKVNVTDKVEEVAKVLGKTDTGSLQVIKHAIRESLGKDLWLRLLERRIEEERASRFIEAYSVPGVTEVKSVLKVVVGDIGYRNEFDFVKGRNGLLIGLRASEKTLYERVKDEVEKASSLQEFVKLLKHPSTKRIPSLIGECDFIIDTDNVPLPEAERKVDEIVKKYFVGELY